MAKTPRWRRTDRSGPESGSGTDEAGGTPGTAAAVDEADSTPEPTPEPEAPAKTEPDHAAGSAAYVPSGFALKNLTPVLLLRAAHPRQVLLTAFGLAVAAAFAGRPSRELALVFCTALVGQTVLGWFNDLVDARRDLAHARTTKPVAVGRLDPGTLWFAMAIAVFVLVPLSIGNGVNAGLAYLASVAVAVVGTWGPLRRGFWSWLPWAVSFALYPAFLSYGGWGGQEDGNPPQLAMTLLAAFLGVGVHLLTALWGLVADNEDGWTYLPLKLGLRLGASRLLWVALAWIVVALAALAYAGSSVGLAR
jgi:4-hydroxybenzoate polyprenyltransferase